MKARRSFLPIFVVAAIFSTVAGLGLTLGIFATQKLWPNPSVLIAFEALRKDISRAQAAMPERLPFTQLLADHPPDTAHNNIFDDKWLAGPQPAPLATPPRLTLPMQWPQRVDHQRVLVVSQGLKEPVLPSSAATFHPIETTDYLHNDQVLMEPPRLTHPAISATPPPALPRPKPRITTTSAPAPVAPSIIPSRPQRGPGQVAVLRIAKHDGPAEAVLELVDGRVVTAGTGSDLGAFRITRIQGNRVWIRIGRREKSLAAGQVFSVR